MHWNLSSHFLKKHRLKKLWSLPETHRLSKIVICWSNTQKKCILRLNNTIPKQCFVGSVLDVKASLEVKGHWAHNALLPPLEGSWLFRQLQTVEINLTAQLCFLHFSECNTSNKMLPCFLLNSSLKLFCNSERLVFHWLLSVCRPVTCTRRSVPSSTSQTTGHLRCRE